MPIFSNAGSLAASHFIVWISKKSLGLIKTPPFLNTPHACCSLQKAYRSIVKLWFAFICDTELCEQFSPSHLASALKSATTAPTEQLSAARRDLVQRSRKVCLHSDLGATTRVDKGSLENVE